VTTDIPNENTGSIGLLKDSRIGGNLFGNLISLRDNLLANEKEAIVERDFPLCERMQSTGFSTSVKFLPTR
jgi:hypothetical protein